MRASRTLHGCRSDAGSLPRGDVGPRNEGPAGSGDMPSVSSSSASSDSLSVSVSPVGCTQGTDESCHWVFCSCCTASSKLSAQQVAHGAMPHRCCTVQCMHQVVGPAASAWKHGKGCPQLLGNSRQEQVQDVNSSSGRRRAAPGWEGCPSLCLAPQPSAQPGGTAAAECSAAHADCPCP